VKDEDVSFGIDRHARNFAEIQISPEASANWELNQKEFRSCLSEHCQWANTKIASTSAKRFIVTSSNYFFCTRLWDDREPPEEYICSISERQWEKVQ